MTELKIPQKVDWFSIREKRPPTDEPLLLWGTMFGADDPDIHEGFAYQGSRSMLYKHQYSTASMYGVPNAIRKVRAWAYKPVFQKPQRELICR